MSFYVQTVKNNGDFYTGSQKNDLVFRSSASNTRIHIGTTPSQPAPLLIAESNVSIRGDAFVNGNLIMSRPVLFGGISLYPSSNLPDASMVVTTGWIKNVDTIYTSAVTKVAIGKSNPVVELDVNGDLQVSNRLFIGSNGAFMNASGSNIGIGTSNPVEALHVAGNILTSSNLTILNRVAIGKSNPAVELDVNGDVQVSNRLFIGSNGAFMNASGSNIGIGTSNPVEALHVAGNILSTGLSTVSDALLKTNVCALDGSLDKLKTLMGCTFVYVDDSKQKLHSGFIAQDVQKVIPHVVSDTSLGFKTLAYQELIPYIIESIKELSKEIKTLQSKIDDLMIQ